MMRRNKLKVVTASALVLLFCTPLWAQQSQAQQDEQTQPSQPTTTQQQGDKMAAQGGPELQATRQIGDFTVKELTGLQVANIHRQDIGEIEQIAIGPNLELYAIVSAGGFLGMGEETVAVPFRELKLDDEDPNQVLITATTTKDSLEQQAAVYSPELYQSLDEDKLIAHFAGTETSSAHQDDGQQQSQSQSSSEQESSPSN